MKLADLGEFGLIDRIASRIPSQSGVVLGIGDDAAALLPTPGCLTLITSDMLIEGVHFDLGFTDPASLGRKSLAVNLSDLAAMGATPRQFLLGLALPAGVSLEFVDGFLDGLIEMAHRFDTVLVGGDTCASKGGISISITALGEQRPERVLKRSGAQPGDLVLVTGTVGDAAAGLRQLFAGVRQGGLVRRQLDPEPRVAAGGALADAGLVHAMIDVSDGVLADLTHICDLSGVGARIDLARLPLSEAYRALEQQDPYALALTGGEDYELLFTVAPEKEAAVTELLARVGTPFAVIGAITAGTRVEAVAPDGSPYHPTRAGFDHFG